MMTVGQKIDSLKRNSSAQIDGMYASFGMLPEMICCSNKRIDFEERAPHEK